MSRRFADTVVVDRVDLEVRRGTIAGLLAQGGAGRTTVIDLEGRFPDRGRVQLLVETRGAQTTGDTSGSAPRPEQ